MIATAAAITQIVIFGFSFCQKSFFDETGCDGLGVSIERELKNKLLNTFCVQIYQIFIVEVLLHHSMILKSGQGVKWWIKVNWG